MKIGTAKVDITAFKEGVAMLGYGKPFNIMKSIETRLYARAFVFKNGEEKFAYVHGGAELTLNKGILTIGGDVDSEAAMRLTLLPFSEVFGSVVSIRNTLRIPKFVNGLYQAPNSHPIEKIDLSGLQFDAANTELKNTAKLDETIALLVASPDIYIEIAGHSNQMGDEESNEKASLQKALLVKQYFLAKGIKKSRLRTNGYGSSRPIDSDTNSVLNQRIDITVLQE